MPIVAFDATPREPMPGRRDLLRGTLSEFVAMTLFVFFGCGAAASNAHFSDGDWDPASVTVIALQFGLAITVLVYATAHTSGGHVNAAVTLGLTVSGKCHPIRGAAYFIAQMLGSIAGAAILKGATHGDAGGEDLDRSGSLGSNGLQNASVNHHNAVAFEFVGTLVPHARGTFLLMYTVLETAVNGQSLCTDGEPSPPSPVCIPVTGCSINPTRSFGRGPPAVVSNTWDDHWVWWVGPCAGSLGATMVWLVMMSLEEPEVVTRRKTLAASPSAGSIDGRYTEKAPPGTLPAN
ncbi:hypothetical protein EMIHUDRAFT_454880 [Emiliania huxleyi CCMP1516]|uniref:Aquaporin n=2 Tax=Emiliania huxleyi TaxID=2903 RepID=A0A0D3KP55_EMIH1|nr:hypothetical protein EMIHUDRAFT_454880 [Emiliania huxleyi CCMP1516]EOD37540.1 hypothetical protein EMIHUDRAFT_454880 [Emiliania huxleyi CCMP1516]|eukprot:XP_005789969.1 hypothetical protein EMIHUDRAFT_454880 [Emiliania huxleyi CCMP1516]